MVYTNWIYIVCPLSTVVHFLSVIAVMHKIIIDDTHVGPLEMTRGVSLFCQLLCNVAALVSYYRRNPFSCASSMACDFIIGMISTHLLVCAELGCGRNISTYPLKKMADRWGIALPPFVFTSYLVVHAVATLNLLWTIRYTLRTNAWKPVTKFLERKRGFLRKFLYLQLISDVPFLIQGIFHAVSLMGGTEVDSDEDPEILGVTVYALTITEVTFLVFNSMSGIVLCLGMRWGDGALLRRYLYTKCFCNGFFFASFFGSRIKKQMDFWIILFTWDLNAVMYVLQLAVTCGYIHVLSHGWGIPYHGDNDDGYNADKDLRLVNYAATDILDISQTPIGYGHTCAVYKCQLRVRRGAWKIKSDLVESALKVYKSEDSHALCRELFNLRRIASIGCINVVKFLGVCMNPHGHGDGGNCLSSMNAIFEYCTKGSIKEFLYELRSDSNKALTHSVTSSTLKVFLQEWAVGIANGMTFLVEHSIIHGDLAARNVLLTENLTPKITDFGLSYKLYGGKIYDRLGYSEKFAWRWMAPEVLLNLKLHLEYSDVWSFGVLLWELFSLGLEPWEGYNWTSDFASTLQSGVRPGRPTFSSLSMYDECIMPCWEFEYNERPKFNYLNSKIRGIAFE